MRRITFRHRVEGEVVESELIVATKDEWATLAQADDPSWCLARTDRFIFANRLLGVPVMQDGRAERRAIG